MLVVTRELIKRKEEFIISILVNYRKGTRITLNRKIIN